MPVITHNSLNAAAAPIDENSLIDEAPAQNGQKVAAVPSSNIDLLSELAGLGGDPSTTTNVVSVPMLINA